MYERALEQAADELRRRQRRALHALVLAVSAAAGSAAAVVVSVPLAVALAAGAVAELLVAAAAAVGRRELVARLAVDQDAYRLPEVAAYGARIAARPQLVRLAAWLADIARDRDPFALCLADRVTLVADELEALARELRSPARSVKPASAVACRRLLTHMAESPLYNPRVPVDDLYVTLRRIRAGIA